MAARQPLRFTLLLLLLLVAAYGARAHIESKMLSFRVYEDKLERVRAGQPADVLLVGESRTLGVTGDPRQAGDHRIYNLSMPGMQGVFPVKYMVERYLEHNPAPQVVLLGFDPVTYSGWRCVLAGGSYGAEPALDYHLRSAARVYSVVDLLGAPEARRHPRALWKIIKAKLSLNALYRPLLSDPPGGPFDREVGTALFDKGLAWQWSDYADRQAERAFRVHPEVREHLEGLIAIAERRGFRIVAYAPPIFDRMHAARQRHGFYADYFAFLDEMEAAHPGVFHGYRHADTLGHDAFVDGKHYSPQGSLTVARRSLGPLLQWMHEGGLVHHRAPQGLAQARARPFHAVGL